MKRIAMILAVTLLGLGLWGTVVLAYLQHRTIQTMRVQLADLRQDHMARYLGER